MPPESVLPLTALSVLSALSVTVRLPRFTSPVAASVAPRTRLPLPSPDSAATDRVPALTVVPLL